MLVLMRIETEVDGGVEGFDVREFTVYDLCCLYLCLHYAIRPSEMGWHEQSCRGIIVTARPGSVSYGNK